MESLRYGYIFSNKTTFLSPQQIITDLATLSSCIHTRITYTTLSAGQTKTSYNPYL